MIFCLRSKFLSGKALFKECLKREMDVSHRFSRKTYFFGKSFIDGQDRLSQILAGIEVYVSEGITDTIY